MARIPASVRTKNPSAMWPGKIATQFGSTSHETLNDGQGNKIAIFPTYEQGAAAQFALWASAGYAGKTLRAAIDKWSGHNSSAAYASSLAKHIPGLSLDTVITVGFLKSEKGLEFMKLQAQWEAGQAYPMTDEQWKKGQELAFGHPDLSQAGLPTPTVDIPVETPEPEQKTSLLKLLIKAVTGA